MSSIKAALLFAACAIPALACDIPQPGSPRPDVVNGYINFETIPTRAVALSSDGARLFALNVPDGRLEIFDVDPSGLRASGSVSVGLDPIALAVRNDAEVWVVNHLSDSVSIVDVSQDPPRVRQTLLVGDEPRDIVFAGANGGRAFITAARRGQNHPDDTVNETQVPGLGRADVWVFDADAPGAGFGGDPLTIVTLFADKPGALAATPDGSQVYVSIFSSGNGSSVINDEAICGSTGPAGTGQLSSQDDGPCALANGGTSPGGVPAPNQDLMDGTPNPRTGILTQLDRATGAWLDVLGRDHRAAVPFEFPDNDVFRIDAMADPPEVIDAYQAVSTLNFNLAFHPTNGKAYLATIEAINRNRFLSLPIAGIGPNLGQPGPVTADPITGRTLRGHLYESRIAILEPNGSFRTRHLNKHIDYEAFPTPPGTLERSVANPQGLTFSPDGETLYVAALGSNQIVPFSRAALEDDSFVPDASTHVQLAGDGGPTDMVIDPADPNRMFVYKRFDNAVAIVDLSARREVASLPLFNPEPDSVRVGRKFFYDATLTSDNGEANCNVCHPAADKDDLAWNIAIPFVGLQDNPNSFVAGLAIGLNGGAPTVQFNSIKGPMTVLTLRGIKDSGPLLWRGDMTNAADPLDERTNFLTFGIAFDAINGKTGGIPQADLENLANWAMSLVPPPNPHRSLDNQLNPSQARGRAVFTNSGQGATGATDVIFQCSSCHALDRSLGQFGTGGQMSTEGETQFFKVPQLRTVYDKVGMFGQTAGDNGDPRTLGGPRVDVGPQIRTSGTLHDGSAAGAEEFLTADVFQLTAAELRQVVDFTYAFESNVAPIVGQQITLGANSDPRASSRVSLFEARAGAPFVMAGLPDRRECELVAKGVIDGSARGFLFDPGSGTYTDDRGGSLSSDSLRNLARRPGQQLTFTCVYPGGGRRIGIDRDQDGVLDGGGELPNDPAMPGVPDMGAPDPIAEFLRQLFGTLFGG